MSEIYRYEVPVDDHWHTLNLSGAVYHVAARQLDVIEFWALHSEGYDSPREFRVFATGQPLPDEKHTRLVHVGTALNTVSMFGIPTGQFVWHLMERRAKSWDAAP